MNTPLQQLRKHTEEESDSFSAALFLGNLWKNRWLVGGVTLLVAMAGALYSLTVTPVYEANILIQIKRNAGMAKEFQGDLPAATEVEILRSRSIISSAVDTLHLDISVEPKRFPILGALIMGRNKEIANAGLFGYGGYVWGAEKAEISVLNLPDALLGRSFILTVAGKDEFVLSQKELAITIRGRVKEVMKAGTPYGDIEILVAQIPEKPGAQFSVSRSSRFQAVKQLQKSLVVSENGKLSNIIGVSLKGSNPELLSRILNQIGTEYIRQYVAQQSEDAEKALLFYTRQLDEAKQNLQQSDDKVAQVRRNRGVFDVNEEGRTLSQQSVVLQGQLAESKQRRDELLSRYLEQHPAVILINKHLDELNRNLATIEGKKRELAAADHEMVNITRDKQINSEINAELLNARNKLDTFINSNNVNVRLVDRAESPVQPVTLKTSTMISMASLAGMLLGVIASIIKNRFAKQICGPRDMERSLGLMVSAAIPHCENNALTYGNTIRKKNEVLVPPQAEPSEEAIESLRILRSTVQFLIRDPDRNIIMVTGPTAGVGKSFIAANFAMVMGAAGKSVLLIDCDMRRGDLHRYFGLTRTNGLSDMLAIDQGGRSLIHRNVVNNVDFISSGIFPTNPAELLVNADFGILLRSLAAGYNYVLIDTPPVLNFSDALIVGVHAELIFNVVRDGVSSMNDAEEAVRRLNRAGLAVTGMIINDRKSHARPHGDEPANAPAKQSRGYQNDDEEAGRLFAD